MTARVSLLAVVCAVVWTAGCSGPEFIDPGLSKIREYPELDADVLAERIASIDEHYTEPRRPGTKVEYSLETALLSVSPVNKYEALWRAVRACAWLAHNHTDRAERLKFATQGQRLGREAILRIGYRVETHYYLAQCLAAQAKEEALPSNDLIEAMALRIRIAYAMPAGKTFDSCGPARFLGTLMVETQDAGFGYTVGTLEEGLAILRDACEKCPTFGENWLRLAQALNKAEEFGEAGDALTQVLRLEAPPDHSWEHGRWLEEAQVLQAELAGADDGSVEATTFHLDDDAGTVPASGPDDDR